MNKTTRTNCSFPIVDFKETKTKVLNWLKKFDTFCFLDNHQYQFTHHSVECLAAAGAKNKIQAGTGTALEELQQFINSRPGSWLFGHLGYDLKNEIENLESRHPDPIGFPDLCFFEPQLVLHLTGSELRIEGDHPERIFEELQNFVSDEQAENTSAPVIQSRISKDEYITIIRQLQDHIHRGDCYEINFCQEFFAPDMDLYPVAVYKKLSNVSPNPFSALYRLHDKWLICASPERFLKRQGNKVYSQPIKGTARRNPEKKIDDENKTRLMSSQKERSENVMVVDLVRNDLSRVCKKGSVEVDELFGIYSFPQVHQMISTVSGELKDDVPFSDIIRACFPMGSMTGAPKKRVMQLIEEYERTKRGVFSGALGYISPNGDFDFNVVIRTMLYNAQSRYLSFQTGSAITFYSDPVLEWEECLLKAAAIKQVLL